MRDINIAKLDTGRQLTIGSMQFVFFANCLLPTANLSVNINKIIVNMLSIMNF